MTDAVREVREHRLSPSGGAPSSTGEGRLGLAAQSVVASTREGTGTGAAPWRAWRPLSAHVERVSAQRKEEERRHRPPSARVAPTSGRFSLVDDYQRALGCLPVSHSMATGRGLAEASKNVATYMPKRGLRQELAAARPKSAQEYIQMRQSRYGFPKDEFQERDAESRKLRGLVAKHEEAAYVQTIGVRPKPRPVDSSSSDDSDPEEEGVGREGGSSPRSRSSRDSRSPSRGSASARDAPLGNSLRIRMPSRKSMGPLSRQPTGGSMDPGLAAGSPTPIVREAERPDPYRLLPPEPWNIRRDKEPSRRAFIVNRPIRGPPTDWKGRPSRPLTAPPGGLRPGLPRSDRFPRPPPGERPRRVPTRPLEKEVESARETLQFMDKCKTDPRLAAHFNMNIERVTRSRTVVDSKTLEELQAGARRAIHQRARFESQEEEEEAVLSDTLEAALFRVLQGRDNLLADITRLPGERAKLRTALLQVTPLLERMYAHYCQQIAPGGWACPPLAASIDGEEVQTKLTAKNFTDMKSLVNCEMEVVREEEIRVEPAEVDALVDLGDYEDLESYQRARAQTMKRLMDGKRAAREGELRAEMEALQAELILDRPFEGPLITFSQFWRFIAECRMSSSDATLAAINRLILPPSQLVANTLDEMAAGRDFRVGYRAALRWVIQSNNDAAHATKMNSLAGVISAAQHHQTPMSATARKNAAAAASAPVLNTLLRHGGQGRHDRRPSTAADSLPTYPNPAPSSPTVRGYFSCNGAGPYGNGGLRAQVDIRVRVPGHRSREQSRSGTGAAATKLRKAIRRHKESSAEGAEGTGPEATRRPNDDEGGGGGGGAAAGDQQKPYRESANLSSSSSNATTPRITPRNNTDDPGAVTSFTLEMLLDSELPHSPYAAGPAFQRSRLMDFLLFSESVIRVLYARYHGKSHPTVAECLLTGLQVHGAFFEKAVAFAEAEAARVAALPTPRHTTVEIGEDGEETPEPPPPPPLFVPANVVQWKELMASDEIQELVRTRQCRLMKIFLYFGQDVTDVPVEEKLMGGPVMSFNDFLALLEMTTVMDAQLDPRRARDIFQEVTGAQEVVSGQHKNNRTTEMFYDEFQEVVLRCAMVVRRAEVEGAQATDHLRVFIDDFLFAICGKHIPGRF